MKEVGDMKLKRIDFFAYKDVPQYGVQQAFTQGLQAALRRLNILSDSHDYKSLSHGQVVAELAKNSPDCTAGFNVIVAKHSPIEPLGIPHLSMIVDCATYYPELLDAPHAAISFVEEDSVGLFKRLGVQNVFYLPHAIDRELLSAQNVERAKKQKRDLDIVMCGSFHDGDEIIAMWKDLLSEKARRRLMDLAEEVLASPHRSHLQAFVELVELKDDFEGELKEKSIHFFDLMNSLEVYLRSIDRLRYLQAIEVGDIHIFGYKKYEESWKKALKSKKRLFFHPDVPYTELPAVMQRAKVVLNSMPTIKRGLHERILLALSQGASVLSNENSITTRFFPEPLAHLALLPPDYSAANALLEAAFKDEEARLSQVLKTHETILQQHTWDVRAQMLLKTLPPIIESIKALREPNIFNLNG